MLVQDVMTVRTARIRHNSNLRQAAEIVALSRISDLMVVDPDNRFLGVLSEGDILRAALPDVEEIVAEGGTVDAVQGVSPQALHRNRTLPAAYWRRPVTQRARVPRKPRGPSRAPRAPRSKPKC